MIARFHRSITSEAIKGKVSSAVLKVIIDANLRQDNLNGLIGHPEFHFDDNAFEAGRLYISQQYELLKKSTNNGEKLPAWEAFGRITHAVQDFYAHSNYVNQWVKLHPDDTAERIDPLMPEIINGPDLRSGRIYSPWETMAFIPIMGKWLRYLLPRDSHAWMNLDSPRSGSLFEFARISAVKRTRVEFQFLSDQLAHLGGSEMVSRFLELT